MKALGLKRWSVGGALIGALAFGGCSSMHEQTWTMSTTDKIPSATGKVKVKGEKDGNTRVKVEVAHLAQPSSTFDATTYVVWLKPESGRAQNVGVLQAPGVAGPSPREQRTRCPDQLTTDAAGVVTGGRSSSPGAFVLVRCRR